jgi:hypothetical protein
MSMLLTVPLVLNPRFSSLAAAMLPLPETVDWTTPRCAVTIRVCVERCPEAGPTSSTAATIAPASSAPSA